MCECECEFECECECERERERECEFARQKAHTPLCTRPCAEHGKTITVVTFAILKGPGSLTDP